MRRLSMLLLATTPIFAAACSQAAPNPAGTSKSVASASAEDKQKITDFVHCLNNMPTCTAGNQNSWGTSLEACLSPLETINC